MCRLRAGRATIIHHVCSSVKSGCENGGKLGCEIFSVSMMWHLHHFFRKLFLWRLPIKGRKRDAADGTVSQKENCTTCPETTVAIIDDICCTKSVSRSLVDCGWIEVRSDGIVFKNFYRHNSQVAKARALESRKKRRQRAEDCPDTNGTNAGPEERREDIENKKSTSSSLSARINLDRDRREWVGILEAEDFFPDARKKVDLPAPPSVH